MKTSLGLIYLTLVFVLGDSCTLFQCAPANQTICVSYSTSGQSTIAYLKENICLSGQTCSFTTQTCTAISTETNRLPGRRCTANIHCQSNYCFNGFCKGVSIGWTCSSSKNCDVGLYCNSQVCTTLLPSGATCNQDNDCTYGFGCLSKKCTPWGTLPNGATIDSDSCDNYMSNFCSSGQCYKNSNLTMCIAGATYSGGDIVSCTSDSNCTATSGSYSLKGKCTCGINPTGTSYCSLFMGSSYGVNYWSAMGKWTNSTAAKSCHKAEDPGNALKDFGPSSDYAYYAHYSMWFWGGQLYQGMLSCVLNTAFPQLKDYYSNSFGYAILASLGVFIIA